MIEKSAAYSRRQTAARVHRTPRRPGNIEQRTWQPVHHAGVGGVAVGQRHQDKRTVAEVQGQHLDSAFMAQHQAGVHIHHASGQCHGFTRRYSYLHGVLQRGETPPQSLDDMTSADVYLAKKTRPNFDSQKMMHTFAPS